MSDEQVEVSYYSSKGDHKDTLIEQIKADRSIKIRNGHWEEPEDWQQADLMIVPDEGCTIDDVMFTDQTPLYNRHNIMMNSFIGTSEDNVHNTGIIYFTRWES